MGEVRGMGSTPKDRAKMGDIIIVLSLALLLEHARPNPGADGDGGRVGEDA